MRAREQACQGLSQQQQVADGLAIEFPKVGTVSGEEDAHLCRPCRFQPFHEPV